MRKTLKKYQRRTLVVVISSLVGFYGKPFQQSIVGLFNCWSNYFGVELCGYRLDLVSIVSLCVGTSLELYVL